MKKFISIILSIIMLCSVFTSLGITANGAELSASSTSATCTSGDFKYTVLSDGTAEITAYTGSATELDIPSALDGYTVTSIGEYAFEYCTSLTNIKIPDSVTSIGNYAFSDCTNLKNVYITDISAWCNIDFYNYYSNPLSYAENLYLNNKLVTDLVIPDSVTSIGKYAFYHLEESWDSCFTSVTIGDSVTNINESAFSNCTNIKWIKLPDSVAVINVYAFENCDELNHVFYSGSESQWNSIVIGTGNASLTGNTIHYNSTAYFEEETIAPTCTTKG